MEKLEDFLKTLVEGSLYQLEEQRTLGLVDKKVILFLNSFSQPATMKDLLTAFDYSTAHVITKRLKGVVTVEKAVNINGRTENIYTLCDKMKTPANGYSDLLKNLAATGKINSLLLLDVAFAVIICDIIHQNGVFTTQHVFSALDYKYSLPAITRSLATLQLLGIISFNNQHNQPDWNVYPLTSETIKDDSKLFLRRA